MAGNSCIPRLATMASRPLPREGYPGVVDAETALARELARSIASALREFDGH